MGKSFWNPLACMIFTITLRFVSNALLIINGDVKQRRRRRLRERKKKQTKTKTVGFDWQNNNFARESRFFVHFFAVPAQVKRENTYFHVLSRTGTQNDILFLLLNFDTNL